MDTFFAGLINLVIWALLIWGGYTLYVWWTTPASYTKQLERLEGFVNDNPMSDRGDYWLVDAFYGGKVGLVFGYPDNHAACWEIADQSRDERGRQAFLCREADQ